MWRSRSWPAWVAVLVLVGGVPAAALSLGGDDDVVTAVSSRPPPAGGWFQARSTGVWPDLPGDRTCEDLVHPSRWEPRPGNRVPNHHVPGRDEVRASFEERPRTRQGAYDPLWDTWLLPRVSGQHEGTTDENIQWAACKWGLADNLLRAVAFRESDWWQQQVYPDGSCVEKRGCGDVIAEPSKASRRFCDGLARDGVDYQRWYGDGRCPRTFSIVGVMSWQAPEWGAMPGNQNGTFPFNRDSTAFALDYLGAFLRGCQEGWARWLGPSPERGGNDSSERLWGCVGAWYAGSWDSPEARRYVRLVQEAMRTHPWLDPGWAADRPPCTTQGCPRGTG